MDKFQYVKVSVLIKSNLFKSIFKIFDPLRYLQKYRQESPESSRLYPRNQHD